MTCLCATQRKTANTGPQLGERCGTLSCSACSQLQRSPPSDIPPSGQCRHFVRNLPPPSCRALPFQIVPKFANLRGGERNLSKCRQQRCAQQQNSADPETPPGAGVSHSLPACIRPLLLILMAWQVFSDLTCVFSPIHGSGVLPPFFVKSESNWADGGRRRMQLLSCNLNLRTCRHKDGNNQIIHRDKTNFTVIQSNNWTCVLKAQEIPGHRPCKSAPFSEAESIKTAD